MPGLSYGMPGLSYGMPGLSYGMPGLSYGMPGLSRARQTLLLKKREPHEAADRLCSQLSHHS